MPNSQMRALFKSLTSDRARRLIRIALPALIVLYAAALRLDAITQKYGPAGRPAWLHTAQVGLQAPIRWLRPARLAFEAEPIYPHRDGPPTRYFGDPYTYLRYAREMTSFYAAHAREPGYPFVTKVSLRLLEDQDVAVSVGSVFCAVLLVLATYLLGALAFSWWVGVGAALAMAIEADAVGWSAAGGRDDCFTLTVVLFACALLTYLRKPSVGRAVLLGVAAGASCLVRITAPTFILPALLYALVAARVPGRDRLRHAGLAALVMAVLVAPYAINCWRVFGQPFYAINGPAHVYQAAEGQATGATATQYVRSKLASAPYQTLDTIAEGMTSYPFNNKWHGFDPWLPMLGAGLSWAALAGLVLFAGTDAGRALLVVLITSLVPYSVTWKLSSEWRLTEVAYPFFLLAAFSAIAWVCGWATRARWRALRGYTPGQWWHLAWSWAVIIGVVAVGYYIVGRALPAHAVEEQLAAREPVTIAAGGRDGAFFGDGWSRPTGDGVVVLRDARAPRAVVWLPLPEVADYGVTIRLDPFPRPGADGPANLPTVHVLLNRTVVGMFTLRWDPERVGAYDVKLPRAVVHKGLNRLEIVAIAAMPGYASAAGKTSGRASTFSIWYVRVRPAAASAP